MMLNGLVLLTRALFEREVKGERIAHCSPVSNCLVAISGAASPEMAQAGIYEMSSKVCSIERKIAF